VAKFEEAIETVLKHEGGFVNNPNDPGGATNFGISARFLNISSLDKSLKKGIDFNRDNYINAHEIKKLPKEAAIVIYKRCWWDKYRYGEIRDQDLATKVFDISVNIGPYQANTLFQESINSNINNYPIKVDGIIGSKTINAANIIDPKKLLIKYKDLTCDFYRALCREDEKLRGFLKGWLNRAND